MITARAFADRRYAVLGLARSGAAAVESLLASGAQVLAWDRQEAARQPFEGRVELADPLERDLAGFAGVVVSPGVPLNTHPIRAHAAKFGVPLIGDIELFAQARAELPAHKLVGITGTNGKSTTTALIAHILTSAGVPALMGGNIGAPILAQNALPQGGVYVLELSSYQIDLTHSLDCDVAVLLNITPDHLDRYDSLDTYAASKARLLDMQSPHGLAVIDREAARRFGLAPRGKVQWIDAVEPPSAQARWPALQGPHNLQNALAAVAACRALGIKDEAIAAALESFNGLAHRMERVVEHRGVLFVNDSKATNTASSAPALAAFPPDPHPRIHWIVGGLAKEEGLGECAAYLDHVAVAYTIGEAGPRFAELLEPHVEVERCELMCEAVKRAHARARAGDVVLLSPACASFDQFRDFEARGSHFRQLVAAMIGAPQALRDALAEGRCA